VPLGADPPSRRFQVQGLAGFVMRGRLQAALIASAFALLSLIMPLLGLISSATVGLVTLRKGANEGLITAAFAVVLSGLVSFVALGSPIPAMGFALAMWLPVWLLGLVLRQSRSLDLAIQLAVLLGVLIVLGIHLQTADPAKYWTQLLEPMRASLVAGGALDAATSKQLVAEVSRWMTGAFAAAFYFQVLLALLIARWLQALLYNPGGFGPEFRVFRVRSLVGYLGLGLLIPALLLRNAVWPVEALLLLAPLFFLQGVAVVHGLVHGYSLGRGWLVGFYVLLVLVMPHAEILVAGLGFVDVWADVRARVAARRKARD
jgi:hypothetical protein